MNLSAPHRPAKGVGRAEGLKMMFPSGKKIWICVWTCPFYSYLPFYIKGFGNGVPIHKKKMVRRWIRTRGPRKPPPLHLSKNIDMCEPVRSISTFLFYTKRFGNGVPIHKKKIRGWIRTRGPRKPPHSLFFFGRNGRDVVPRVSRHCTGYTLNNYATF